MTDTYQLLLIFNMHHFYVNAYEASVQLICSFNVTTPFEISYSFPVVFLLWLTAFGMFCQRCTCAQLDSVVKTTSLKVIKSIDFVNKNLPTSSCLQDKNWVSLSQVCIKSYKMQPLPMHGGFYFFVFQTLQCQSVGLLVLNLFQCSPRNTHSCTYRFWKQFCKESGWHSWSTGWKPKLAQFLCLMNLIGVALAFTTKTCRRRRGECCLSTFPSFVTI